MIVFVTLWLASLVQHTIVLNADSFCNQKQQKKIGKHFISVLSLAQIILKHW